MKTGRWGCCAVLAAFLASGASFAQDPDRERNSWPRVIGRSCRQPKYNFKIVGGLGTIEGACEDGLYYVKVGDAECAGKGGLTMARVGGGAWGSIEPFLQARQKTVARLARITPPHIAIVPRLACFLRTIRAAGGGFEGELNESYIRELLREPYVVFERLANGIDLKGTMKIGVGGNGCVSRIEIDVTGRASSGGWSEGGDWGGSAGSRPRVRSSSSHARVVIELSGFGVGSVPADVKAKFGVK